MRPIRVTAALLAASLASLAVAGCGSQKSGADAVPAGSSVSAGSSPTATDNSAAMKRFSKLVRTINAECREDQPTDANGKKIPRPEDVPGYAEQPVDGYGPDNPPPTIDGIGPDPNSSEGPPEDYTPELKPEDFAEIPLDAEDQCIADKHADRIREGFSGKGTTSAKVLHSKLMKLDYPASGIYAMPAQGGSPPVRPAFALTHGEGHAPRAAPLRPIAGRDGAFLVPDPQRTRPSHRIPRQPRTPLPSSGSSHSSSAPSP